jgi:hypothetical protein
MIQSLAKPTYTPRNSRILGLLWERPARLSISAIDPELPDTTVSFLAAKLCKRSSVRMPIGLSEL